MKSESESIQNNLQDNEIAHKIIFVLILSTLTIIWFAIGTPNNINKPQDNQSSKDVSAFNVCESRAMINNTNINNNITITNNIPNNTMQTPPKNHNNKRGSQKSFPQLQQHLPQTSSYIQHMVQDKQLYLMPISAQMSVLVLIWQTIWFSGIKLQYLQEISQQTQIFTVSLIAFAVSLLLNISFVYVYSQIKNLYNQILQSEQQIIDDLNILQPQNDEEYQKQKNILNNELEIKQIILENYVYPSKKNINKEENQNNSLQKLFKKLFNKMSFLNFLIFTTFILNSIIFCQSLLVVRNPQIVQNSTEIFIFNFEYFLSVVVALLYEQFLFKTLFCLIISFINITRLCISSDYKSTIKEEYLIYIALVGKTEIKKNSVNIAEVNPNIVGNVIYRSPTKSRNESPVKFRIPQSQKKNNSPEKYRVIQDDDDTILDKNNQPVQQAANLSQIEDIENFKQINLQQNFDFQMNNITVQQDTYQSPKNINKDFNPYDQGVLQEKNLNVIQVENKNTNDNANNGNKVILAPLKKFQNNNKELSKLQDIDDKENNNNSYVPPTQISSTQNKDNKSHNFDTKFSSVSNSNNKSINLNNNNIQNQNQRYAPFKNHTIEEQDQEMDTIYNDNDNSFPRAINQSNTKQPQIRRKKASHLNQIVNSSNQKENNPQDQQYLNVLHTKQQRNQLNKDIIAKNQALMINKDKENQSVKSGTDSLTQTFQVINCDDIQQQTQNLQQSSKHESSLSLKKNESHSKIYKTTHEQQKKQYDKKNMLLGYQSPIKRQNSDQLKDIEIIQQPSTNRLQKMQYTDNKSVLGEKTNNIVNTQEKLQSAIKNSQLQKEKFDKKFGHSLLQVHKCENDIIQENEQNKTPASRKNYLSKKDLSECHSFQEKLQKVNSQHYYGQKQFFNNVQIHDQHLDNLSDCSIERVDKEEELIDNIQIKKLDKQTIPQNNEKENSDNDLEGEEEEGIDEFQFQNIHHSDFMKTQNYEKSDVKPIKESISKAEIQDFNKSYNQIQVQQQTKSQQQPSQQENGKFCDIDLNNMELVNTIDDNKNNKSGNDINQSNLDNQQIKGRPGRSVTVNNHHRKINGYMVEVNQNPGKPSYDKPITPKYQKGPNPYLDDSLQNMKREQEKIRDQLLQQKNNSQKSHSRHGSTDKSSLRISQKMKSVLNAYGCVGDITDQGKQVEIRSRNNSQRGSRSQLNNNSNGPKLPSIHHSRNMSTKNNNSQQQNEGHIKKHSINKIPQSLQYTSPVNSEMQISQGIQKHLNNLNSNNQNNKQQ